VNCRGSRKVATVQELGLLIKTWKSALVFLMETRLSEERIGALMKSLGFPNGEVVAANGLSGGLALFWRRDIIVSLQSKSRSHIDVILSCANLKVRQWRFTGFYGEPRREMRKNNWYLMRFLHAQLDLPWLCAGDFNEVMSAEEHMGLNVREAWQMEGFQDTVADCGFPDLGFSGLSYTWDNDKGNQNVKAHLDRAFGDHRFLDAMGDTTVKVLPTVFSDHVGLLIEVKESAKPVCSWPRGRRSSLGGYPKNSDDYPNTSESS
jgi:hypothetical protein